MLISKYNYTKSIYYIMNNVQLSYEKKVANCTVIAKPMATEEYAENCYKLIKKAKERGIHNLLIGLKDVQRGIRKGVRGIVILAGDVMPIEIMCHLPAVCEEANISYIYVPSRVDLGAALGLKRSCITVLIKSDKDYEDNFSVLEEMFKNLSIS